MILTAIHNDPLPPVATGGFAAVNCFKIKRIRSSLFKVSNVPGHNSPFETLGRLLRRLEVLEQRGYQFGHRGMNMHRARNHRIRGIGIH